MSELGRRSRVTVWLLALIASTAIVSVAVQAKPPAQQAQVPAQAKAAARAAEPTDGAALDDFTRRLDEYVALHGRLAKESPKLKETTHPGDIIKAQDALATSIRTARQHARRGDIFTPQVATMFRRLMYPELAGQAGQNTKGNIDDEQASIRLKVNAKYPATEPLQTLPPNVLANLPQLPEDVEYRVVGKDLVLRDVDANIIVDFIPNAIRS